MAIKEELGDSLGDSEVTLKWGFRTIRSLLASPLVHDSVRYSGVEGQRRERRRATAEPETGEVAPGTVPQAAGHTATKHIGVEYIANI